jgi:hypothetical protein
MGIPLLGPFPSMATVASMTANFGFSRTIKS